jgi:hypothetical protein
MYILVPGGLFKMRRRAGSYFFELEEWKSQYRLFGGGKREGDIHTISKP